MAPAKFTSQNDPVSITILVARPHIATLINSECLVLGMTKEDSNTPTLEALRGVMQKTLQTML
jgi:hypothetical protein